MKILICDDNSTNRKLLRVTLEAEGHEIVEATNGEEALAILQHEETDAIVSDILMPKMDGYRFCSEIRARPKYDSIPFLIHTSTYLSPADEALSLELGADAFLKKPSPAKTILAEIEKIKLPGYQRISPRSAVEPQVLTEYNETLVRKLEKKNIELEEIRDNLQRTIKTLVASEVRYRHIFERNPLPMWVFDITTLAFLDVNEAAVRHYGYSKEEFLKMTVKDIRPPENVKDFLHYHEASIQDGPIVTDAGIWKHQKKDGTLIDMEITWSSVIFQGKQAELVLANDVTERQKAEKALLEQARFSAFSADIGLALTQNVPLSDILRSCCEAFVSYLDAAFARIWTLNGDGNVLELQASAGMYTHLNGEHARVTVGHLKIGLIAQERKPHLTNNVIGDSRVSNQEWAQKEGMIAFAGYPLIVGDKLVGVIAMFSRSALPDETLTTMESAANEIALVIQREKSEQALRRAEENYRSIFENAAEGIFQSTPDGKFSVVNPAIARMLGYESPEEMQTALTDIGKQLYVDPTHRIEYMRLLELHGQLIGYESELYKKDGGKIWVSTDVRAVRDRNGKVLRYEGFVKDITERKRALREIKMRPLLLASGVFVALFMIGSEIIEHLLGKYVGVFWGASTQMLITISLALSVVYFTLQKQRKLYEQSLEELNERRRAEEALQESNERFRQISETISEVFWMANPEITKMLYVSPAYETVWGRTCQSLYDNPRSFMDALHPEDRESTIARILEKQKSGEDHDFEYRIIRPDGSVRWIWDRAFAIRDASGKLMRFAGVAQDITERKDEQEQRENLEKQLLQTQKIEAIGQLAGGVAHDYNNTLMAIGGYAELLHMKLPQNDPLQVMVNEIQKGVTQGGNLTRQLLAFSRKQVLLPSILDLNQAITKIEDMVRRLIGEDVKFQTSLANDLGFIKADPGQIHQVILNLAVNARDAMPRGGTLKIETSNVVLDDEYAKTHAYVTPGSYVQLNVSDTGIGMEESTVSRIFEPFFTTKEEGKGTGLGLSTVYGIVKQSGGHISVYSEVNLGTTFRIYFPRVDEPMTKEKLNSRVPLASGKGEVILLVDDNEAIRSALGQLLQLKGYKVFAMENGAAALKAARVRNQRIDLLITDMVMPEMGGQELARQLRSERPEMKVLYMSGYAQESGNQNTELEPGSAFLPKPANSEALLNTIRRLME